MGTIKQTPAGDAVIEVRDLNTRFGAAIVHENVNISVYPGEIFALVGGSGTGKSTLLREVILLQARISGSIRVFGQEVVGLSRRKGSAAASSLGRDVRTRGALQLPYRD